MLQKSIFVIAIYSSEKQLIDTLSYPLIETAQKSRVNISIDSPEEICRPTIENRDLYNSILHSAAESIEEKNNFKLAIIIDHSIEKLQNKIIRLNQSMGQNDETLLVSMLLYDGRTSNNDDAGKRAFENTIDSFYEVLKQNDVEWIRTYNSVTVYRDSIPIKQQMYISSYRYCMRVVNDDYSSLACDIVSQFTDFFHLFYNNPHVLRSMGKRKPITAAVEIDRFLSSNTENWDLYYLTGSVVSSIIDTFEKLKSKTPNGYCLTGPSEHSLICGAIANWQLYMRSFIIVVTSGMGDELKGTLSNLKQSGARGFIIIGEANLGARFSFQGTNHQDDNIIDVMNARKLPVVSFNEPEKMHEDLEKAFYLYNSSNGPVVLFFSTRVLMSTAKIKKPVQIPCFHVNPKKSKENLDDIINIINNEESRIVWRCGFLTEEEYQLVEEISEKAGIVLADGITRPGSIPQYKNGSLNKNYFGAFSLYGYSKKIYRYLTDNGKVRNKKGQVLFILKSKLSQISSPFSEAALKNKFRIVQVNNNPSHIAPFVQYSSQMDLIDFLKEVKSRLNVSPNVLSFRKNTIDNTDVGKDTYCKSIPIQPMLPNYFFTEMNNTIEQLIKQDNYTYIGIYDVGRNGISAFRNISRTGPGFSGWYGRALMGDALLAVNSIAVTSKDNILAFIGDGAKKCVPDIKGNMIDNILHQRKELDVNISVFYLINGFYSLISTYQESFLHNRGRRQMSCVDFLASPGTFKLDNITINQYIIKKYDPDVFETALKKKGEINFFYVLLSHNNAGDGLSLASLKLYDWQDG